MGAVMAVKKESWYARYLPWKAFLCSWLVQSGIDEAAVRHGANIFFQSELECTGVQCTEKRVRFKSSMHGKSHHLTPSHTHKANHSMLPLAEQGNQPEKAEFMQQMGWARRTCIIGPPVPTPPSKRTLNPRSCSDHPPFGM